MGKTVAAMNAEAKYLKAYDTVAGTPSGLDTPSERSSAYDLALIAREGLSMPDFRGYVGTRHAQWTMPHGQAQTLITHDHLLANYDGAIGVKNGYTVAAQATFIGAATRNGHTLIATLMHSTVGPQVWREDAALLDWGFAALGKVQPVGQLRLPRPAGRAQLGEGGSRDRDFRRWLVSSRGGADVDDQGGGRQQRLEQDHDVDLLDRAAAGRSSRPGHRGLEPVDDAATPPPQADPAPDPRALVRRRQPPAPACRTRSSADATAWMADRSARRCQRR